MHMNMYFFFFSKFEYFMYLLVTGFLIWFFSGIGSISVFLVDRFDDRSGYGNFDFKVKR
jgi:hypothetical protein